MWIDSEGIMLSEITQLYVESRKAELRNKEENGDCLGLKDGSWGDNWSKNINSHL